MYLRRKSKREWFLYMMEHREKFWDMGARAVYVSDNLTIMFWKCVQ
jgi:hypothetical protein